MTVNITESISIVPPIPRPATNPIISKNNRLSNTFLDTFPDAVLPDTALSTIIARASASSLKNIISQILRRLPEDRTNDPSDESSE